MHPLSLIVIVAFLASAFAFPRRRSLGIPLQKRSALANEGVVNLEAIRSHVAYSERKYLQGMTSLQRNAAVSTFSSGHLPPRAVGADPLMEDRSQHSWYGSIYVGSPAVEYKVDCDTGSADLFLPALDCDSTCNGHKLYSPDASSSAVDLSQNFTLSFSDGYVTGERYSDTVSIAGFVAKNQTFGAASHYSSQFPKSDGLMGMSFANISMLGVNPVIQTLIAEGQLPDPIFAFKLAASGSELRIGSVNPSLYTGSFTYAPVTRQGFWQINVDSINANGKAIDINTDGVVDTGTSFILGDAKIVGQFYSAFNATKIDSGFYTMPCDAMPDVSITIRGKPFAISPDLFNLGSYKSSDNCIGAVVAQGNFGNTWILGDAFLQNVYSVFDLGGLQVGFADLA